MQIDLGTKFVTIHPWKAGTKKELLKTIKTKQTQFSETDLLDILFYPYLDEKDKYYSDDEIQYLVLNLRDISIPDDIVIKEKCKKCGTEIEIRGKALDFVDFQKSNYNKKTGKYTWRDLKDKNSLERVIKQYPDEFVGTLDMLLHLESIDGEKINSFKEVMEYYDNLSIIESEELENFYEEVKSKLKIHKKVKCPSCGFENIFEFKTLPGLFDALFPKELRI